MLNNFKRARLIAGMTQHELADLLGVSAVSVHNWECGRNLPKAKRLKDVAHALHTTTAELLDEERAV